MKITKYEHACFTVEIDGKVLVVDPGNFTKDLNITDSVVGIVITHPHADHFDPAVISDLFDKNPDSLLISLSSVTDQMPNHTSKVVNPGDSVTAGPFNLSFFGGLHAPIHETMQTGTNVGVMINDTVYYPGDSFTVPERPIEVLALPVSGPWLKTGDVIDYLLATKPKKAFLTHDGLNADSGKHMYGQWLSGSAEKLGTDIIVLNPGQSIEA
jgi:L-ascorbate metabolism protein UlaG (beta-lactamase superfamily)